MSNTVNLFREPGAHILRDELDEIVVLGTKGGVGATFLAANLGVYFASLGRNVHLVDGSLRSSIHHLFALSAKGALPIFEPGAALLGRTSRVERTPGRARKIEWQTRATGVPQLELLEPLATSDVPAVFNESQILDGARKLKSDVRIIDFGVAHSDEAVEVWRKAKAAVLVVAPDPSSVENAYRWARRLFLAAAREAAGAERESFDAELHELSSNRWPETSVILEAAEKCSAECANRVEQARESFGCYFIVNQVRTHSDLDLGRDMVSAAYRRLNLRLIDVGHVDYDDAVWHATRERRTILLDSPGSKASRYLEKVARRLLAVSHDIDRWTQKRPDVPEDSYHCLLEVERGGSDEEIRRAYKRLRDVFANGSLAVSGLFQPEGLRRIRERLEEAHDVLLDSERRRPYELSIFPKEERSEEELPQPDGPLPTAPAITPETIFTGPLIRAIRESKGLSLTDISERTKVGKDYLRAIELDDYVNLPATVYVRGFVAEYAKCLKLDADHVRRTYIRHLEELKGTRGTFA